MLLFSPGMHRDSAVYRQEFVNQATDLAWYPMTQEPFTFLLFRGKLSTVFWLIF